MLLTVGILLLVAGVLAAWAGTWAARRGVIRVVDRSDVWVLRAIGILLTGLGVALVLLFADVLEQ